MKRFLFSLGAIWAFALSIWGYLLGLFLLLFRQVEGVSTSRTDLTIIWDLRNDGWFYRKAFEDRGWVGFSCGGNIFVKDYDLERWRRTILHETKHCYQQYAWGIFFPLLYILDSVIIWFFIKEQHSYYDNGFEKQAREYAGQLVEVPKSQWASGPRDRWAWW